MLRPEQQIHKAVFAHLKARGAPGIFAWHTPNGAFLGGKRNRKGVSIQGSIFKSLGVVAGIPDVIAIKLVRDRFSTAQYGQIYALELKAEGGRVTSAQEDTAAAMRGAGAIVGVTYGLDAALAWLEQNGLLVGRAA